MEKKELLSKFFSTTGVQLLAKVVAVASGVFFARTLGPEEYGMYGYILSLITVLTLPSIAGLPNLIIREVASFQIIGAKSKIVGIKLWSRAYSLTISIVVCLIVYLLTLFEIITFDFENILIIGLILVPIKGFQMQQTAMLNGFRKPVIAQLTIGLISPSLVLLVCMVMYVLQYKITVKLVFEILVVACLVSVVITELILNRLNNSNASIKPEYEIKRWFKSLLPFMLIAIIGTLNTELAVLFLGGLSGPEHVAYFKVAMQGTLVIAIGLNSLNSVIMPNIARMHSSGDVNGTQKLITQSVRLSVLFSLPVFVILMFFGSYLIEVLFGVGYLESYKILVILCLGQMFSVFTGSVGVILNMTKNEQLVLRSSIVMFILTLIIMPIAIIIYDDIGAAVSVSIVMVCFNVLRAYDLYKITGLKSWIC